MTAPELEELSTLAAIPAGSGDERLIAERVRLALEHAGLEPRFDSIGNVLLETRQRAPACLVTAHMDQVGFMVSRVDGARAVCLPVGDPEVAEATDSMVLTGDGGCQTGSIEPTEDSEGEGLVVLEAEAPERLSIGDRVLYRSSLVSDGDGKVRGGALDNRIGCWVLLEAARRVVRERPDIAFAWTVREELDAAGAIAAARGLGARAVVSVDVTSATSETRDESTLTLGEGPAITLLDEGMVADRMLLDGFVEAARREGIPWQPEVVCSGVSEAGRVQSTLGTPSLALLTVVEDPHSPSPRAHLGDVVQTRDLLVAALLDVNG